MIALLLLLFTRVAAWAQDDQPVRTVADSVKRVTVSADRKWMAWYGDGDIQVWDFVGVVMKWRWVAQGSPTWLRLSPDDRTLVVGLAENRIEGYDLTGKRLWSRPLDNVNRPAVFSADSSVVTWASQGDTTLMLADPRTGRIVNSLNRGKHIEDWAFSPALPELLVGWADDTLDLYRQDGSKRLYERPLSGLPRKIVWSPNGRRVLLATGPVTRMLATSDWTDTLVFDTPHWRLTPVAWSPGGPHFAVSHFKAPTRWGLSLREMPRGRIMRYDDVTEKAQADFSPDDHLMAITTDKVRVYRTIDADLRYTAPDIQPREAWFAAEGHRMMVWTWGGQLEIWDF